MRIRVLFHFFLLSIPWNDQNKQLSHWTKKQKTMTPLDFWLLPTKSECVKWGITPTLNGVVMAVYIERSAQQLRPLSALEMIRSLWLSFKDLTHWCVLMIQRTKIYQALLKYKEHRYSWQINFIVGFVCFGDTVGNMKTVDYQQTNQVSVCDMWMFTVKN